MSARPKMSAPRSRQPAQEELIVPVKASVVSAKPFAPTPRKVSYRRYGQAAMLAAYRYLGSLSIRAPKERNLVSFRGEEPNVGRKQPWPAIL